MRQLAAIMFADMSGFTALMQENEQLAKAKRVRLKEVLEKCMSNFGGKILQYYGDGSLSIFKSAIDGTHCAIEIQQLLQEAPHVPLRVGLHTGDIIVENETIYGDGVNLASRIESLAVPGSILISEKIYDEIRNQENIETRELGYFELKNIKHPVRIFAIANPGLVVPGRIELKGKRKEPTNRLAVLPFVNMSADPENEYFSDGITEELLNTLTRIDGLQVTSRTSSFAFKDKQDDVRDIAVKLNVDKVLEGSVRKSGNKVRITAQLINAIDGYHIWSEHFDRDLTDIFEVQDEISHIIANKLRENLAPSKNPEPMVKAATQNIDAYTLYLKGLHFWNKLTPADTRKSIEYFERAIAKEPGYAQAYAMTAAAYSFLGSTGQMLPARAYEIVHRYADKALMLDDSVAEGHIAKGVAYLLYDWQFEKGYASLQKALELNPTMPTASQMMSFYYIMKSKYEEAIKLLERAVELDPLSPSIINSLGDAYFMNEQYDDAIEQADKLLEMNPEMRAALESKGWAIGMKGDWNAALEIFKEVQRLTNHPLKGLSPLGYAYAMVGENDKAMECIRKIEQRKVEEPDIVIDGDLVGIWFALGDMDKMFYHIDQCIEKRMGPPDFYLEYPMLRKIKKDPRYRVLMEKAHPQNTIVH